MKALWGLGLVFVVVGCSSVRNDSSQADAAAKRFEPLAGKAAVYIFCKDEATRNNGPARLFLSFGDSFAATHRAQEWAMLPPHGFVRADLNPGKHCVVALFAPKGTKDVVLLQEDILVAADQCYFWELKATPDLQPVGTGTGATVTANLRLTESYLAELESTFLTTSPPNGLYPYETYTVVGPGSRTQFIYAQRRINGARDARAAFWP